MVLKQNVLHLIYSHLHHPPPLQNPTTPYPPTHHSPATVTLLRPLPWPLGGPTRRRTSRCRRGLRASVGPPPSGLPASANRHAGGVLRRRTAILGSTGCSWAPGFQEICPFMRLKRMVQQSGRQLAILPPCRNIVRAPSSCLVDDEEPCGHWCSASD